MEEIQRVLTKVYEDEQAGQNSAAKTADNDDVPDGEDLDDEGSGAEGDVKRPLIAISKWRGFFTDNVSLRLDGCSPCL